LHCVNGDGELRVEVKGTTSDGSVILLTSGEVVQARADGATALYVLSGIDVTENGGTFTASGGEERVIANWEIVDSDLAPLAYRYKVPPPPRPT